MESLKLAAYEFIDSVALKLKGHGIFLTIRDVEAGLSEAKYRVTIDDGKYGNTYEFAVSRPGFLYERDQTAEIVARNLHYNFHRDLEYFNAEQAYKVLSNEGKAAFNTACLERYLELEPYEYKLATELYESGLFDGYVGSGRPFGYTIRPKSIAMQLWSRMKGKP